MGAMSMAARSRNLIGTLLTASILLFSGHSSAQERRTPNPFAVPSMIDISYDGPRTPGVYQREIKILKEELVLEQARRFLSPLNLNKRLAIRTAECGQPYIAYLSGEPVTLCYEYVKQVLDAEPGEGKIGLVGEFRVSRQAAIAGPIILELLHNVALAIFDIQGVSVWGRADSAADNVAAFLMLQFGTDVAFKSILGTAYFLNSLERKAAYTVEYLGDIRPTIRQRYYDIACIAYGQNQYLFSSFMPVSRPLRDTDIIGVRRTNGMCYSEYAQLRDAFERTIMKLVEKSKMAEVLATKWIPD
jgi:hypothetical protein